MLALQDTDIFLVETSRGFREHRKPKVAESISLNLCYKPPKQGFLILPKLSTESSKMTVVFAQRTILMAKEGVCGD
jgi:hypothetical protein